MARPHFELDEGFEAAVLRSEGVRKLLEDRIDDGVRRAKSRAPKRLGFLRDGIVGNVGVETRGDFAERGQLIGRIASTDFKTVWAEFGTVKRAKEPFLRPTLEELGTVEERAE